MNETVMPLRNHQDVEAVLELIEKSLFIPGGHKPFAYFLLVSALTALEQAPGDYTTADVPAMFTDDDFRLQVMQTCTDSRAQEYMGPAGRWQHTSEAGRAYDYEPLRRVLTGLGLA